MLIFGLSASEVLLATLVFVCTTCGNNAPHHLIKRVRKFSLFFVPLFPVSTSYSDTCVACGRVIDVSREDAEAAASQSGPGFR